MKQRLIIDIDRDIFMIHDIDSKYKYKTEF